MLGIELARHLRRDAAAGRAGPARRARRRSRRPTTSPTSTRAARRHPRRGAAARGARQPRGGGRSPRLDRERRRRARLRRARSTSTSTAAARSCEACRAHGGAPRLVFTSSLATFGGELALGTVDDGTRQTPLTTYGATKAMLELLFADATRKGFLDARSARPPTVIVRPGAPNAAASGFASAVVREPLAGRPTTLPVSLDQPAVVIGVDTTVGCLARLLEIDGDELGDGRALNLPGLVVTRARAAGRAALARGRGDARSRLGRDRPGHRGDRAHLGDRLALLARRRARPAARRGRGRRSCAPTWRGSAGERGAHGCARRLRAPGGRRALVSVRRAGRGLQGRRQDLRDRRARAHAAADHAQVRARARRARCAPSTPRSPRATT